MELNPSANILCMHNEYENRKCKKDVIDEIQTHTNFFEKNVNRKIQTVFT